MGEPAASFRKMHAACCWASTLVPLGGGAYRHAAAVIKREARPTSGKPRFEHAPRMPTLQDLRVWRRTGTSSVGALIVESTPFGERAPASCHRHSAKNLS